MDKILAALLFMCILVIGSLVYATYEVMSESANITLMAQAYDAQYPQVMPGVIFNVPAYTNAPLF